MKKIYLILASILFFAGCSDFLDSEDLTKKTSGNFPGTPAEAQQALTGIYSVQNTVGTGWGNIFLYSEYMSDDRFGGGGQHDPNPQAANYFLVANTNIMSGLWAGYYQGIYRANTLLKSLDNVAGLPAADKKQIVGEISFLRGLYYFDLARLFSSPEVIDGHQGTVPLLLSTEPVDLPRATEEALYGQIAFDLKVAIDSMSSEPITPAWNAANLGRASKWAAEGMMARVFLFYTGYYNKTELPLAGGGSITKAQVITWIEDLIANSGRSLVPDFRNQWPYSIDQDSYKYAKDNDLSWVGEPNNPENIYQVVFTGFSSNVWGEKSNYVNGFFNTGQRDSEAHFVIGHGWGFGPVNPRLYGEWPNEDLRKKGSIYYVDDPNEGLTYVKAADNQWNETYYLEKKYVPVNVKDNTTGNPVNWCHNLYPGIDNNIQLESVQNMVLLRLADVYLMAA
ncbi:MAG: RagB/SusD family nutrient uptake outer membrane protein, partial [Chryseolinea sp.]